MKVKLLKLLHLTRLCVLFLGLVEKIALGLTKKLTAIANSAGNCLAEIVQVCDE